MTFASGLWVQIFLDALGAVTYTGTPTAVDFENSANINIALMDDTETPDFSDTTPVWSATNEVSGTGWSTGGVALNVAASGSSDCSPTLSISGSETLKYDMTDVSVAGTTLTNARGCILYFPNVTAPNADAQFLAVTFGSDYSTNNGTFGIQWNASGVFTIDLVP